LDKNEWGLLMSIFSGFAAINWIIVISVLFFGTLFFQKRILASPEWRAMGTPLASIIGSGFLIVAPLLWMLVGKFSLWVLLVITGVGYLMGNIMRYNIKYAEPLANKSDKTMNHLNALAETALACSYFISITFYIQLLSSFLLKMGHITDTTYVNLLSSVIIFTTGLYGKLKGFRFLETAEIYSVNLKITTNLAFLIALFYYDYHQGFGAAHDSETVTFSLTTLRRIGGMLLIVQGFEISRYLGHKYKADIRIKTMRYAQIISTLIYVCFVFLVESLMTDFKVITTTLVIDLSRQVAFILPFVVILGAISSQYSSAIADMIGCGGTINEIIQDRVKLKTIYLFIAMGCIILLWTVDIFQLITLASRAFAFYYFLQCLVAFYVAKTISHKNDFLKHINILVMAILMLAITLFSLPMEG
tara:strand:- start:70542 stop:71792 length:1251 start_codon:yes stop_codon:yes gene_type:complete